MELSVSFVIWMPFYFLSLFTCLVTELFKWNVFPFSHIYLIKLHVKCHIQITFKEY